jgi:glycosyltransferase involved in cell wall biosynthesis
MITVVIPFFNAESTIERCIASITKQTYQHFEVILVNDHSNDGSVQAVLDLTQTDLRFQLIHQTPNKKGPSAARNLAVNNAQGEYLFFADADDWLEPNTFADLHALAHQSQADLVCASHVQDLDSGKKPKQDGTPEHDHVFSDYELLDYIALYSQKPYLYTMLVHCWGKLYKRSIIDTHSLRFDESLSQLEDVNFNFRYLAHSKNVAYKNRYLYHHVISSKQTSLSKLTGTESNTIKKFLLAYTAIEDFIVQKDTDKRFNAERLVGHLFVNTVIIALIRLSRQFLNAPSAELYRKITEISLSTDVEKRIKFYQPSPEESKLIYYALKTKNSVFVFFSGLIRALLITLSR